MRRGGSRDERLALEAVADWLVIGAADPVCGTIPSAGPKPPVAECVPGQANPELDLGVFDPLQAVEFPVDAPGSRRVEISAAWTDWVPVRVPCRAGRGSAWFALEEGAYTYRLLLDGRPVPDPLRPGIVGVSADGPLSGVIVQHPTRRVRLHNPLAVVAAFTRGALPEWLTLHSAAATVPAHDEVELEFAVDPRRVPLEFEDELRLGTLEGPGGERVHATLRVRAGSRPAICAFLPESVAALEAAGATRLEVTGRSFGPGTLAATLRDGATLKVLSTATLVVDGTGGAGVTLRFGPLPAGRRDPTLILDTGSSLLNRRRYSISLSESSGSALQS